MQSADHHERKYKKRSWGWKKWLWIHVFIKCTILLGMKAVKMNNVKCWKKLSIFVRSIGHSTSVRVSLFNTTTWKDLLILKGLINPYRTRYVLIPWPENSHCVAPGLNYLTQIVFIFQNFVFRFSKQNMPSLTEA